METQIEPGDQIFAVAADDDKVIMDGAPVVDESAIRSAQKSSAPKTERARIPGWNSSGATIVADLPDLEQRLKEEIGKLKNQKLAAQRGDIRDRSLLEALEASEYDHVIVLAYHHLETQEADAITLATLLHLRDIAEKDETPFSIVSEMLDLRNRALAEAANADDFIVSDHLVSLAMTSNLASRVNFYAVVEAARQRGETAIGCRFSAKTTARKKTMA